MHFRPTNMSASFDYTHIQYLYGTARVRSMVHDRMVPVVFKWLSEMRAVVFLYGKRAWNMYIDPLLRDATKDVDALVYGSSSLFDAMYAHARNTLENATMSLKAPFHHFVHAHSDGRGKTATFQVCGETLLDLSWRDHGEQLVPGKDTQLINLPSGEIISVLSVQALFALLDAETKNPLNWRQEIAMAWLRKYRRLQQLGLLVDGELAPHTTFPKNTYYVRIPSLTQTVSTQTQTAEPSSPPYPNTTSSGTQCTLIEDGQPKDMATTSTMTETTSHDSQDPPPSQSTPLASKHTQTSIKVRTTGTQTRRKTPTRTLGVQGPSPGTFADLVLCSALALQQESSADRWIPSIQEIEDWKAQHADL